MDSPNDRFLRACRGRSVDATPVWFMRQAGRYMEEYRGLRKKHSILELAKTPELACEVTLQPIRRFNIDAAILFADILLPIEPLGLKLSFSPGPTIANPVRADKDVAALRDRTAAAELGFVYDAVRLIRRELAGKVPLIGFAGAPYTVASYMVEGGPSKNYQRVKGMMTDRPDLWDKLMRKVRRVTADYLKAQARPAPRPSSSSTAGSETCLLINIAVTSVLTRPGFLRKSPSAACPSSPSAPAPTVFWRISRRPEAM